MKTRLRTPPSKLPTEVKDALGLIKRVVTGFDRLTFWIDHPAPRIPVSGIERHCANLKVNAGKSLLFHPVWQTEIEIFQPSREALSVLVQAIGTRHRVQLSYSELALDWLVESRAAAYAIRNFLLAQMYVPYLRHDVTFAKTTAYFAPRADKNSLKSARNVALYDDSTSKLWAARQLRSPCCHLEHRLQGVETLAASGLLTLADCVDFDHRAFWAENLRLFRMPSKGDLGRWLDPDNADVSEAALRKRADRFLNQYRHNEAFVLQDCRREYPDIDKLLLPLANELFLPT
ncbi:MULTISPECIES: hypothetical protein [Ralstonia]|mgnify:CR=1 FL=1|jgi:hypothetical protein|uniref:Uncharacterized protein n=2 Tax=Ralstonia pickettii TaxID=329 RepID=A0ABN9I2B8_RALPI|nr:MULTISPECIES: hypothetical protein [Ralstonia]MBA4231352.1 hypothetical protein [Ralstonia sp.]MBA4238010.1 hypothetical protein [Ralstonia sp.]MBA4279359.1 hypothetical protein [Ralstonia sp.]MBA4295284.1 hypothetical protein [Ralstonia sp.]POH88451.1 hypothetical protein CJ026_017070 [Ralstonia pickettii]